MWINKSAIAPFDIENGPENQIIPSCLAELRHSAAAKSDNLNITKTPHLRVFTPAIRQGIREMHCISTPVISS